METRAIWSHRQTWLDKRRCWGRRLRIKSSVEKKPTLQKPDQDDDEVPDVLMRKAKLSEVIDPMGSG